MTDLILPPYITSVGSLASSIKKIAYPSNFLIESFLDTAIGISYPAEDVVIEDGCIFSKDKTILYYASCNLSGKYVIPTSVTTIGDNAFKYCASLTRLSLPNSIKTIGSNAFNECSGLARINYETNSPIKASKRIFSDITYEKAILTVANGGREKALSTEPWIYFHTIQEKDFDSGIEDIECDSIDKIEIIYNINGQAMGRDLKALPNGLYIVHYNNGNVSKVYVK